MTTKDFQRKSPLMIFLSYFKNHKQLFFIDVLCAVGIAAIDLLFPLVTRSALYDLLPNKLYQLFFIVMVAALGTPAIAVTIRTYVSPSPASLASRQAAKGKVRSKL